MSMSLLGACAPRSLPVNTAPLSSGISRANVSHFNARFTQQSDSQHSDDNFTQYMRKKIRDEGFQETRDPEPILGTPVQALPPATGTKALTYMTYEALDNDLSEDLNRIVDTLEVVGSTPQMNLIAQTDNHGAGNAARYFFQRDELGKIGSPYVAIGNQGENSGDPQVLKNAVRWGFNSYPSRYKWLNISSHGMGFSGINYDDSPEQSMTIMQFNQALKAGLGGKKLDLVSFDACLMATVEVASELQDTSKILIGSEDSTYYWGYGYYKTFSRLAQNTAAMNPAQVARSLVVDVHDKGSSHQAYTISATDLTKISALERALDRLARALRQALPEHQNEILRAVQATREFHMAEGIPYRDINRMLALLKRHVKVPEVAAAADQINDIMYRKGVILFARQSKIQQGEGRGLSIYLPSEGHVSKAYRQTRFARATQWDEFLVELNQAIAG